MMISDQGTPLVILWNLRGMLILGKIPPEIGKLIFTNNASLNAQLKNYLMCDPYKG